MKTKISLLMVSVLLLFVFYSVSHAGDAQNAGVSNNYTFDESVMKIIDSGDTEQIKLLIYKGFDINKTDRDGRAIMHHAFNKDKIEMVKFMLNNGANPNIISSSKNTLLFVAISKPNSSHELIELLIQKGADLNAKNKDGSTALHALAEKKFIDLTRVLVEKGVDVNAKDNEGDTPLAWAAAKNNIEAINLFLEKGADAANKNKKNRTPLYYAARENALESAKLLIEKGVDVNAKDNDGMTPLIMAGANPNAEMIKLLLEKGADVNAKGINNFTPLHALASYSRPDSTNSIELVRCLIEKGADINARTMNGKTPLDVVRSEEIKQFLIKSGAK